MNTTYSVVWKLHRKQTGRTLVELMIAMAIGLVILLAITSLFVANRATYRTSDDKSRLDEDGRLALNLMAFHVRMAGYGTLVSSQEQYASEVTPASGSATTQVLPAIYTNLSNSTSGANENIVRGCAGGFVNPKAATVACNSGTSSDALLVRYVVDSRLLTLAGGTATDCLGAALTLNGSTLALEDRRIGGSGTYYVVENRFFVQDNGTTGVPELYCIGNGGTAGGSNFANAAQPIAENVEQMKITYGYSNAGTQSIDQYLTADNVPSWENVVSAKICLVVRSANNGITTAAQSYRDCGDVLVTATDRRLRGVFSTTVTLRSRSVGAI